MARTHLHGAASGPARTRFHANRGVRVEELRAELDPVSTTEELKNELDEHIDPLPTKDDLGERIDPLPTKAELEGHVTGLHEHINEQLPTKAELGDYVAGLHGRFDQLPTQEHLDTQVAGLHGRFDQLPTKDDFKKVAQIIDVIHFILKKWFGIELGELTPEQREKLTHSLRALNRVEALVLDTNLNLEQGNEILNQLSQDTEMQNLLLLLHGIETTGHPTLSDSFRAMLNNRLTSGDIEERTAWLGRIQDLRGAIIQHVARATGNPPQAESV